ncbi:NADPH--cytochrome P450 reductase, partial [Lachnellula willkommii]
MSQFADITQFGALQSLLHHTRKDDVAFLALIIFSGIIYTRFIQDKPDPYHHVWFEKPQATDASGKGAETRDIGQKLEESKKDLVVFWGSQSGTAEGLAARLVRDFRSRFGLDVLAADLSDYDPESIHNISEKKFAIFIISTYGEGDPSDNTSQFMSWLKANKSVRFDKLRYAAFGLGNKKYKFYNKVIDTVVESLDHLGAAALMPVGKADDSNGATDEDFTEWKQSLFSLFHEQLGFAERPEQYEPTLRVVQDTSLDKIDLHIGEPIKSKSKKLAAGMSTIEALPIRAAKKLLSTVERNCLHLELDTNEFPELKYKTGDHLAVWPSNPTSEIQRLVNVLDLQEVTETPLLIQSLDPSVQVKVPSPTTWEALLQYYLEICAPVPREVVLSLAQFAPSEAAKATLKQLGADKDVYHDYCSKNHVTLGRLLEIVSPSRGSWSTIPLSFVLESLPTLSPRYYSISSSSVVSPKNISITVATSSEPSPTHDAPIPGLTTDYLLAIEGNSKDTTPPSGPSYDISGPGNALEQGNKLFAHIRKSKFRLPILPKTPIIMVASGSGVAPFRGFLTERARMVQIGRDVGESHLFFGCRSADDYLYREELEGLQQTNGEIKVVTAFSRSEKNRSGGRAYVQDRVEEN